MRRTTPLTAALVLAGAVLGACSQQDDPTIAELRADISEQLQEIEGEPTLDQEQADCYARLLVQDQADVDDFVDVRFSESEPEVEGGDGSVARRIAAAAVEARTACDLPEASR